MREGAAMVEKRGIKFAYEKDAPLMNITVYVRSNARSIFFAPFEVDAPDSYCAQSIDTRRDEKWKPNCEPAQLHAGRESQPEQRRGAQYCGPFKEGHGRVQQGDILPGDERCQERPHRRSVSGAEHVDDHDCARR